MAVSMIDLENRVRTIEQRSSLGSGPSLRFKNAEYEPNIPQAENIQILATFNEDGVTTVVLGWIVPDDPKVETFEIWVKDITNEASGIVKMAETREPPATLVLQSDATTAKTLIVRTRMRSGVGSALNASPTATAEIRKLEVGELSLADGAVTTPKLADLAATNAKIGNLAVTDSKIQSLAAGKITAGTLVAGVVYAGTINANQINAGTLNSVNVNAGTYTLVAGVQQMFINGSSGFLQTNTAATRSAQIINGQLRSFRTTSFSAIEMSAGATGGILTITSNAGAQTMLLFGTQIVINGQQVVTSRQSTVSDPAGGGTVDSEARTAINAIIDRLQAHGLIS